MQYDPNKYDPSLDKQIVIVDKTEVRTYWNMIEPALTRMQQEKQSGDKWVNPEVYASIVGGNSTLAFTIVGKDGLSYKDRQTALLNASGFLILQQAKTFAETNMLIWIASRIDSDDPKAHGSMMFKFGKEINEFAKFCGCTGITFNSNRDFWVDVAPRVGFEVKAINWYKAVV